MVQLLFTAWLSALWCRVSIKTTFISLYYACTLY